MPRFLNDFRQSLLNAGHIKIERRGHVVTSWEPTKIASSMMLNYQEC